MRGALMTIATKRKKSAGTSVDQVRGDNHAHPGLELGDLGLAVPAADERAEDRLDARENVRHARQVGQHVVAVEAHERQQLLEQDQVLDGGGQQGRLLAGGEEHAAGEQREDPVEVDPAEVGTEAPRPVQAVGVRDLAVERGIDEVETDTHHSRMGAGVSAGAGVAELVERGGHHHGRQYGEQELRVVERATNRPPRARGSRTARRRTR